MFLPSEPIDKISFVILSKAGALPAELTGRVSISTFGAFMIYRAVSDFNAPRCAERGGGVEWNQ